MGARRAREEDTVPQPSDDRPVRDVAGAVTRSHEELRQLLDVSEDDRELHDRRREFDAFVVAMCEHLGAVEQVLHPAVRRHLPDADVEASASCHRGLQRRMREVEQIVWGDARVQPSHLAQLRDELCEGVAEHAAYDEPLAQRLDEALDPAARRQLVEAFTQAALRGPTRPHPYAPHTGPLVRPVRWLAARWDEVLDVMDVRTVAGRRPPRRTRPVGLWGGYVLGRPPTSVRRRDGQDSSRP
jgi:hypothetical protein